MAIACLAPKSFSKDFGNFHWAPQLLFSHRILHGPFFAFSAYFDRWRGHMASHLPSLRFSCPWISLSLAITQCFCLYLLCFWIWFPQKAVPNLAFQMSHTFSQALAAGPSFAWLVLSLRLFLLMVWRIYLSAVSFLILALSFFPPRLTLFLRRFSQFCCARPPKWYGLCCGSRPLRSLFGKLKKFHGMLAAFTRRLSFYLTF